MFLFLFFKLFGDIPVVRYVSDPQVIVWLDYLTHQSVGLCTIGQQARVSLGHVEIGWRLGPSIQMRSTDRGKQELIGMRANMLHHSLVIDLLSVRHSSGPPLITNRRARTRKSLMRS